MHILVSIIFVFSIYKISINKSQNININKSDEIMKSELEEIIMSETGYKDAIIKMSKGKIVYKHYNDFDSDGICEMFAIVGKEMDDDTLCGEIWFANQKGACKLEESRYYWKYPFVYLFGDDIFIAFDEYYTTGTITYLWGVQNGNPFQPSLTEKANGFTINNYNEVVITHSAYDAAKIIDDDWKVLPDDEQWVGHTWNQYYYYWNGNSFREYGAIEITVDELLQIDGTNELVDYINDSGAVINEIFYRDNNVIQINYQKEERESNTKITYYKNIMFRYKGKRVTLEECAFGDGIILRARNTSLAVYPDDFDIDLFKTN